MALIINGVSPTKEGQIETIEKDGICIYYKSRAIKSTKVVPHFYVYKAVDVETGAAVDTSACLSRERRNENEGPWHRETKQALAELFNGENEVFVKNEKGEYRIADILVNNETVVELQNSPMSPEEFYSRNHHYLDEEKEVAWILSQQRAFISSENKEIIGLHQSVRENNLCTIKYSNCPTFYDIEHLELEDIPVFIDLEETYPGFFAQLVHVEEKSYGSYRFQALFQIIKKENLLKRIKTRGIYKTIREKIAKMLWSPHADNVLNTIRERTEDLKDIAEGCHMRYNIHKSLSDNVCNRQQLEAALRKFEKDGYNVKDMVIVLNKEDRKKYITELREKIAEVESCRGSLRSKIKDAVIPKHLPDWLLDFLRNYISDTEKYLEEQMRPLLDISCALNAEVKAMEEERNFSPSLPKIINTELWLKSA